MSDLFKDHKPELSDDEDRRLWQRVRAIPGEAEGFRHAPVPWWRALWAMPAVRYGAPAFAVLVAAVVWVTERGPERTLKVEPTRVSTRAVAPPADQPAPETKAPLGTAQSVRGDATRPEDRARNEEAPTVVLRDVAPPTDRLRAGISSSKDEKAQAERQEAALDTRGGASAEREVQQEEQVIVPAPAPAKTTALRKGEPAPAPTAQTFAPPPKEAAKNSAPSPSANWGSVKSNYRDSGSAGTQQRLQGAQVSIVEGLEMGVLPGATALTGHAIIANVADAARLGPLSGRVSFPKEAGVEEDAIAIAIVEIPASGPIEARRELISDRTDRRLFVGGATTNFESAPPRLQVAVLAFALEQALAGSGTPRYQLENMLELSKKIARRSDASTRPGADRLTRMFEGALRTWPKD